MRRKTTNSKTTNSQQRTTRRASRFFRRPGSSSDQRRSAAVLGSGTSEFDGWLRLASSGRYVQVFDACENPIMAALVSEDACWQFAVQDWRARRPPVWQPTARRAWRAESRRLDAKRDRLVEVADGLRAPQPR